MEIAAIVLSSLAFIWTIGRDLIRRASVTIHTGDRFSIVVSLNQSHQKLHILCSLVNAGRRTAVIERIRATINGPNGALDLTWNLFFQYRAGGIEVEKSTDVHALAIVPGDAQLKFIEFISERPSASFWIQGHYTAVVTASVLPGRFFEKSDTEKSYSFEITEAIAKELQNKAKSSTPNLVRIPISQ